MRHIFSNHSIEQLHTLHPDLIKICRAVLPHHDFKILQGHRGEIEQNEAYDRGVTKVKWPDSRHNTKPSEAMDLLPFVNGKFIGWEDWKQWRYFGGMVMGYANALHDMGEIGHRLRWGGDWSRDNDLSDNRFNDLPHFESII